MIRMAVPAIVAAVAGLAVGSAGAATRGDTHATVVVSIQYDGGPPHPGHGARTALSAPGIVYIKSSHETRTVHLGYKAVGLALLPGSYVVLAKSADAICSSRRFSVREGQTLRLVAPCSVK